MRGGYLHSYLAIHTIPHMCVTVIHTCFHICLLRLSLEAREAEAVEAREALKEVEAKLAEV